MRASEIAVWSCDRDGYTRDSSTSASSEPALVKAEQFLTVHSDGFLRFSTDDPITRHYTLTATGNVL
jgi:hypothetical protein